MRASDKEALIHECLVQNYEKYYRMAYSYVFREQDAMDIVQEAAYRAILKRSFETAGIRRYLDLPDCDP